MGDRRLLRGLASDLRPRRPSTGKPRLDRTIAGHRAAVPGAAAAQLAGDWRAVRQLPAAGRRRARWGRAGGHRHRPALPVDGAAGLAQEPGNPKPPPSDRDGKRRGGALMDVLLASGLALSLCYAGLSGLCIAGWLLLALALWPCVLAWGAAVGVVLWLGWLALAGLLLVLLLPYSPRTAALLAALTLLGSLPLL